MLARLPGGADTDIHSYPQGINHLGTFISTVPADARRQEDCRDWTTQEDGAMLFSDAHGVLRSSLAREPPAELHQGSTLQKSSCSLDNGQTLKSMSWGQA